MIRDLIYGQHTTLILRRPGMDCRVLKAERGMPSGMFRCFVQQARGQDVTGHSKRLHQSIAARRSPPLQPPSASWSPSCLIWAHTLHSFQPACQHSYLTPTSCRYRWPSAFAGFCFSFSFRSSSLSKWGITCSSRLLNPPVARQRDECCSLHFYTDFLVISLRTLHDSSFQVMVAYFFLNVGSVQM